MLVGIVILNPFMQHNSPTGKEENNVEEENNSESVDPNSFFINNWGNANHEVTVELLNSKKTLLYLANHILQFLEKL